jgi:hypothetical protein
MITLNQCSLLSFAILWFPCEDLQLSVVAGSSAELLANEALLDVRRSRLVDLHQFDSMIPCTTVERGPRTITRDGINHIASMED